MGSFTSNTLMPGQPVEPLDEYAFLVEGRYHGQVVLLAQREVLLARARRGVDDARAFALGDLVPLHDKVPYSFLRRQFVKGALVFESGKLAAGHLFQHLVLASQDRQPPLDEVERCRRHS